MMHSEDGRGKRSIMDPILNKEEPLTLTLINDLFITCFGQDSQKTKERTKVQSSDQVLLSGRKLTKSTEIACTA